MCHIRKDVKNKAQNKMIKMVMNTSVVRINVSESKNLVRVSWTGLHTAQSQCL